MDTGTTAPDFTGQTQNGERLTLSDFRGKQVALYFYPKDDTPGCTKQACSLRDGYQRLTDAGIAVIGVSADDVDSHAAFAEKYDLPFPLVADPDGAIIDAYGVAGRFGNADRVTFLIDEDGIIQQVFTDIDVAAHADEILEAAQR
jgi:peroxiredoxin Q/BCP